MPMAHRRPQAQRDAYIQLRVCAAKVFYRQMFCRRAVAQELHFTGFGKGPVSRSANFSSSILARA
jgi:hypothetical protein